MVQLAGSLVTQWDDMYPGVPFPTPDQNPQMFPSDFVIKNTTYTQDYTWWDDLWGDCCAFSKCCIQGYIDYQCQYNNGCYLNLVNLGIHVAGFLLCCIVFLVLLGYASRLLYKCIVSVAFVTKMIKCLGGCMKCFTMGVFDQNVYYKNQRPKAQLTKGEKKIIKLTDQLDIKVLVSRLDQEQKIRILQVFEDYQIIDQYEDKGHNNEQKHLKQSALRKEEQPK